MSLAGVRNFLAPVVSNRDVHADVAPRVEHTTSPEHA